MTPTPPPPRPPRQTAADRERSRLWNRLQELSRQVRRIYGEGANTVILHSHLTAPQHRQGLTVLDDFGQILSPGEDGPSPFDLLDSLLLLLGEGCWLLHHRELPETCVDPPREASPKDLPWAS